MFEQNDLHCRGMFRGAYCDAVLSLPSEQPYVTDETQYPSWRNNRARMWPHDEWRANIGCPRCRQIIEYASEDVWACLSDEQVRPFKCLRIDMGCAKQDCKAPFRFFLASIDEDLCRQDSDDLDLNGDIVKLLRDGMFTGKCYRGHYLDRLPSQLYKITPQFGYIPSHRDELHWTKHTTHALRSA